METGKVLLGVMAGVVAGALIGVLFAPEKGSETRKKIACKGEDYVNLLKDEVEELLNTINEKVETMKNSSEMANEHMNA